MTRDPIRAILLNELDMVTMALDDIEPHANLDELVHWTERLRDVNHALQSLGQVIHVTQQERATLQLVLEFYKGNFEGGPLEGVSFLLNKVRALTHI